MSGLRFWQDLVDKTPALDDKLLLGVDNQNVPSYCTVEELTQYISQVDITIAGDADNVLVLDPNGKPIDSGLAYTDLEVNTNKVTTINANSTDTEYPSAKAVYTELQNIPTISGVQGNVVEFGAADNLADSGIALTTLESNTNKITNITASSTDTEYPSAKAVKTYVDSNTPTFSGTQGNLVEFGANGTLTDSGANVAEFEVISNKTTTLSSSSTDTQYPTSKAVYEALSNLANSVPTGGLGIPSLLDKESNLPTPIPSDGTYYVVQNMDITSPGSQGHVWVKDGAWVKVIDTVNIPDGQTITYNTSNEFQVNMQALIDNKTIKIVNGVYTANLEVATNGQAGNTVPFELDTNGVIQPNMYYFAGLQDGATIVSNGDKLGVNIAEIIDNKTLTVQSTTTTESGYGIGVDLDALPKPQGNIVNDGGLRVDPIQMLDNDYFSFQGANDSAYPNLDHWGTQLCGGLNENNVPNNPAQYSIWWSEDNQTLQVNDEFVKYYAKTAIPQIVNLTQNATTGVLTVTYNVAPANFKVQTLAGTAIAGTVNTTFNTPGGTVNKVFTPTTASDILNGGWVIISY